MPLWFSWCVFQACWFLAVLGRDSILYLSVIPILLVFILTEIKLVPSKSKSACYSRYLTRLAIASVGILFDWLLDHFAVIRFSADNNVIPVWLLLLWLTFALSFPACYSWLQSRPVKVAVILGCVFGPLAYWGAAKLNTVTIVLPVLFTLLSSAFWGGLFGVILGNRKIRKRVFTE
nr:DUF2878 domain-containing protein [Aliikangiella coralliicola]